MRSKTDPTPNPTPVPCAFTARFLAHVRDPAAARTVRRTGELLQASLEAAAPVEGGGPDIQEAATRRQILTAADDLRGLAQWLRELGAPEALAGMLAGGAELAAFLRDGAACGADDVQGVATYLCRLLLGPNPGEIQEWRAATEEVAEQAPLTEPPSPSDRPTPPGGNPAPPPVHAEPLHQRGDDEQPALPATREVSPEEAGALDTTRRQLRALGGVLRVAGVQLRALDEALPMPPQPILALVENSDIGPDLYPTVALSGDLQCFAHDLAHQAWQLERVSLGLPATTQPGEPDPGLTWPPLDFPADRDPEAGVRCALPLYIALLAGVADQLTGLKTQLATEADDASGAGPAVADRAAYQLADAIASALTRGLLPAIHALGRAAAEPSDPEDN